MAVFSGSIVDKYNIGDSKVRDYLYKLNEDLTYMFNNLTPEDNYSQSALNVLAAGNEKMAELSVSVDGIFANYLKGDSLIASIALDDSGVTIKADKITLEGLVTANGNFKILTDGSIESKNGKFSGTITGSEIKGNTITGGTISGSTISGNTISGGTISGSTITGGSLSGSTISGNTISGGTISGTNITGSTISGNTISGGTISGSYISGGSIDGGEIEVGAFGADEDGAYIGDFIVDIDDYSTLYSSDGYLQISAGGAKSTILLGRGNSAVWIKPDGIDTPDLMARKINGNAELYGGNWWAGYTIFEALDWLYDEIQSLEDE